MYAEIPDPSRQNDFFNAVARDVFRRRVERGRQPARRPGEHRHLGLGASAAGLVGRTESEQKLLAPTALAGRLETGATEDPQVGVYFNAALPYKLDYYLDYDTSVNSTRCVNGRQQLTVTVDLSSRVPRDFRTLTQYVAPDVPQFKRGTIVTTMYFFAPVDGDVGRADRGRGRPEARACSELDGRPGLRPDRDRQARRLDEGDRRRGRPDAGQTGTPDLQVTPGVRSTGIGPVSDSACS